MIGVVQAKADDRRRLCDRKRGGDIRDVDCPAAGRGLLRLPPQVGIRDQARQIAADVWSHRAQIDRAIPIDREDALFSGNAPHQQTHRILQLDQEDSGRQKNHKSNKIDVLESEPRHMPKWEPTNPMPAPAALALELFVVHSIPEGDGASVKAVLPEHLACLARLEAEGALVYAGPTSDDSGEEMQGMGMIVYRAPSFEHARELAETDPMHKAGARSFILRKLINEGSLTLSVRLSGQAVTLS